MARAPAEPVHAGFWARYAAWSLDAACLAPLVAWLGAARWRADWTALVEAGQALQAQLPRLFDQLLDAGLAPPTTLAAQWLADPRLAASIRALEAALASLLLAPLLLYATLALGWAVAFEASRWQATPGKRLLGLRVVDAQGRRLDVGRALLRHLAAGLSWLSLNLGHALAAVPPHLALHDRLSGTRVVADAARPLPVWAKAWLALQALAGIVAVGALLRAFQGWLDAGLLQALGGA